ncbi:hypothetical protein SNEBB_007068, partial [Seison nebaliae]
QEQSKLPAENPSVCGQFDPGHLSTNNCRQMEKPKLKIWTMEELRKVKKFKEENPQLTLDQMATKLSVSLGRTFSTTRARLGQIDRHIDQMELKMATPKQPIPDIFRSITNKENSPSKSTRKEEENECDKAMKLQSFSELCSQEKFHFTNGTDTPITDSTITILDNKNANDGNNQLCDISPIKFLSSLIPTTNDVILGNRNNEKRRRCNSTNIFNSNCPKCDTIKVHMATQTDDPSIKDNDIILINESSNNNELMIIDPPANDHIIIELDSPDQTLKMARDYFGGKPFEGQQKLKAENYPTDNELVKLAREDMKKAANFIFTYDKSNKTKFPEQKVLSEYFMNAWNKDPPSTKFDKFDYESGNSIDHLQEKQFRYLGVEIDQFGNVKQTTIQDFKELIEKVNKTPLDGRTKFKIVEKFGLPKVLFQMSNSDQTRAELRKINGAYRRFVRNTHRFRHDFPSDAIHLKPNNGGIGATDIEESVARSIYNSSSKMLEDTTSKYFQKVVKEANVAKTRNDNAKYLKIDKMKQPMELNEYHQEKLLNNISKSQRVAETAKSFFKNKRANKWIKNERLPAKIRNDFFKLRFNIMPTNSTTHFFNGGKKKCRGCGGPSENVKHIITKCPATKGLVMDRHNEIMRMLIGIGQRQRGAKIYQEKCFRTEDGIIKPDLIVVNGNTAKVMEIAVTMEENENSLGKIFKEKLAKYNKYSHIFQEELGVQNVIYEPIVMGALGDVHNQSAASIVRNFKTTKFSIQDISTMLLRRARNMVYLITHLHNR